MDRFQTLVTADNEQRLYDVLRNADLTAGYIKKNKYTMALGRSYPYVCVDLKSRYVGGNTTLHEENFKFVSEEEFVERIAPYYRPEMVEVVTKEEPAYACKGSMDYDF